MCRADVMCAGGVILYQLCRNYTRLPCKVYSAEILITLYNMYSYIYISLCLCKYASFCNVIDPLHMACLQNKSA